VSSLEPRTAGNSPARKFHLDTGNAKFLGVCSGLGRYLGVDPMIVRLVFAIGTIVGFGSFILIYFAIALFAD
jgi:phage shock protein C